MITANIHYAKTNLSKLLVKVAEGEEVIITNRGKPVAALSKPKNKTAKKKKPYFGMFKNEIWFAPDYDKADEEVLKMFEESINKPL